MPNPFGDFNRSPEVILLTVIMDIRCRLSLQQVMDRRDGRARAAVACHFGLARRMFAGKERK